MKTLKNILKYVASSFLVLLVIVSVYTFVATDIMKNYGVDSKIGLIASVIMGSTETTFYTIAVYTSSIGVKKIRFVLVAALIADFVGMITSAIVWNSIL